MAGEVFLLVVERSDDAGYVLSWMKRKIDGMLAGDEALQKFLVWVKTKTNEVNVAYKPAAVRAFYFSIDLDLYYAHAHALAHDHDHDHDHDHALALDLSLSLALAFSLERAHALDLSLERVLDRTLALDLDLDRAFEQQLQQLRDQLLSDSGDLKKWWKSNGQSWIEQFRQVMIEHRNIGHDWQFSKSQKELLQNYYDANKLLVDCLKSECYANRQILQHIEDTLLLPFEN